LRFWGKKRPGAPKSLGDRMLEGAGKKRGTLRPRRRAWLVKVMAYSVAIAAAGEIIGALLAKPCGGTGVAVGSGCALGAFAGGFLGGGNFAEAFHAAVLGGGVCAIDYYVIGWGGPVFHGIANISVLGPAAVIAGVFLGRKMTGNNPVRDDN